MKAVVGLGNVGRKYHSNRHNAGFMVVDALAHARGLEFTVSNKLKAAVAKNTNLVLAKPTTMMNASGQAVSKLASYYKVAPAAIFIVHDDLDIRLGEYKVQLGRGPKVHNGVDSVERLLGTEAFWRVRVGVDNRNPSRREPGDSYVLQDFSEPELQILQEVIAKISAELEEKLK